MQRRPCGHDERGVHAAITEAGRDKLKMAAPGHVALVRGLFIDVLTPHELQIIGEALRWVLRHAAHPRPDRQRPAR